MSHSSTAVLDRPGTVTVTVVPAPILELGVPCARRPGLGYRHYDGPCQCFAGGRAPSFPPSGGVPPHP